MAAVQSTALTIREDKPSWPLSQHLTQRRGFDGPPDYGGGALWDEWRFTTVTWLRQEHRGFESLLMRIERMTTEPQEPEEGVAMEIGGSLLTDDEQ